MQYPNTTYKTFKKSQPLANVGPVLQKVLGEKGPLEIKKK